MAGYSDDDSFGGYSDDQDSTGGYSDDQYSAGGYSDHEQLSEGGYSDGEEQDFDDDQDASGGYDYNGRRTIPYHEPREQSSSYRRTAKASYKDKQTGNYIRTTDEVISTGGTFKERGSAGRVGTKNEYRTTKTFSVGDKITCHYAGTKRKQSNSSNSYQRTAKATCLDKQTGIHARSSTKEVISTGDTSKKRPTGRVGSKNEYSTTKTCRVGDKSGYSEYQVQERFRRVDYGGNSSGKCNSGSNGGCQVNRKDEISTDLLPCIACIDLSVSCINYGNNSIKALQHEGQRHHHDSRLVTGLRAATISSI